MFSSITQVPIIIRDTELASETKKSPAQHLDLPPTILRRAGISIPNHWEGDPLQEANRAYDHPIYLNITETRGAVRVGDWKYIDSDYDNETELYHTPHSGTDGDPVTEQYPERAAKLRRLLDEYRSQPIIGDGKSDINNDNSEISDTTKNNLEDLGYM
jgi:arylsulfatase A-like enzyme